MRCLIMVFTMCGVLAAGPLPGSLKSSLTFHASFDKGLDADSARGDGKIYSAPDYKQQASAKPGLGEVDAVIEKGSGIGGGDALRFKSKNTRALYFRGDRHVALAKGTISFWLKLDPQKDLAPGYCDPIQITDKAYNDSAIWVDFTKDEVPRHFRLGVFGSLKAWNPADTPPDKNPDFLRRLVVVERPPFTRERWTHVVVTWSGLDAGGAGTASLLLDGKTVSTAKGIREVFEWDPQRLAIRLGVNYVGLMDEVAVFDRALTESE
ncbi:MAG: LamG domain-containing protein, partial [Opitutaceae bacterium]|nr:LamG domain-containing protein [Verrucomicrobiales bacterium]